MHEHRTNYQTGEPISAEKWNEVMADINEISQYMENNTSSEESEENSHMYVNDKGNLCIETTPSNVPTGKKGKINIEALDDIQLKPGDDLALYAHHRGEGNKDQLLLKVLTEATGLKNGQDNEVEIPAKLRINSADISITNKDSIVCIMVEIKSSYNKTSDYEITSDFTENTFTTGYLYTAAQISGKLSQIDATSGGNAVTAQNVIDDILGAGVGKSRMIHYTNGTTDTYYKFTKVSDDNGVINLSFEDGDGFGYLKIRAQSIDLRCEEHGGIAIQPKGYDGSGNMNKIKFEHGGGDGLEFGTFNTDHTSLFTTDYRFNKNGTLKLATRTTQVSDKYNTNDETTHYKFVKQNDDFYDIIDSNDPTCTWEDIIKFVDWAKTNEYGPWEPQL